MSHSMGKLMDKKCQPVQSLEYFTDIKKMHGRAEPVRLTQALIHPGHTESCRKATREKAQPVKVKELLKELRSTNPSRKKSRPETEQSFRLSVRRKLYNSPKVMENLNLIAETNKSAVVPRRSIYVNNKNESAGSNVFKVPVQKLKNVAASGSQRKSMLLPPNSIKNRYTRMKDSLSLASNIKATPGKTTIKLKASEKLGTVVEAPNSRELLMDNLVNAENTINGNELNKIVTADVDNEEKDNNININPYNINLNSIINIDKQHLIRLQSHCQETIFAREKELSELKQMLVLIENVLESETSKNARACLSSEVTDIVSEKESDKLTAVGNGAHQNDQQTEVLSEEVVDEESIELTQNKAHEQNINSSQRVDSPQIMNELQIDEKKFKTMKNMEEDKENFKTPSKSERSIKKSELVQRRRRSARLAAIEMKLDQAEIDNCTKSKNYENLNDNVNCNNQCTPVFSLSSRRKSKSCRKSNEHFAAYLALKSDISFLQTPDVKRLDESVKEFNTPCIYSKNITTSMSTKLLSELNSLYKNSPI